MRLEIITKTKFQDHQVESMVSNRVFAMFLQDFTWWPSFDQTWHISGRGLGMPNVKFRITFRIFKLDMWPKEFSHCFSRIWFLHDKWSHPMKFEGTGTKGTPVIENKLLSISRSLWPWPLTSQFEQGFSIFELFDLIFLTPDDSYLNLTQTSS